MRRRSSLGTSGAPRAAAWVLAVGGVLAGVAARADAQPAPGALSVDARPASVVAADGGRTVTVALTLRNTSARDVDVTPAVRDLPKRWRLVTGAERVVVPANGRAAWVATIAAPSGAPAGRYVVRVAFTTGDSLGTSGAAPGARAPGAIVDSLVIAVAERAALAARVIEPLGAIVAGEAATAEVRIENRGNARGVITVAASARLVPNDAAVAALPAELSQSELRLEPGESQVVMVTVRPPARLARVTPLLLDVRASMSDGKHRDGAASESMRTIVVPDGSNADRLARVPGRLVLRAGGAGSGLPVEFVGGGVIGGSAQPNGDPSPGAAAVDVTLRGVPMSRRLLGHRTDNDVTALEVGDERTEYRLAVRTPRTNTVVGDQVVALSSLTEPARFASGASTSLDHGIVGVDALAVADRGTSAGVREMGGAFRVRPRAGLDLGAFALQRTGTFATAAGTVGSVQATVRADTTAHLTVEAALGHRSASDSVRVARAARVELAVERGPVIATLRHAARGAEFPDEMRGTSDDYGTARLRLTERLHVDARATRNRVAGGLLLGGGALATTLHAADSTGAATSLGAADTAGITAITLPVERRVEAEVGAYFGDAFGVVAASGSRVGTSGSVSYDGVERRIRLQGGGQLGPLRLAGAGEMGVVIDRLRGTTGAVRRASAVASVGGGAGLWASAYADVRRGPTLWSGAATTLSAGLDARASLGGGFAARVNASYSDQRALLGGLVPVANRLRGTTLDARLEREFAGSRTVALRVRGSTMGGQDGVMGTGITGGTGLRGVSLEYGMPMRLPVWRARRTNQVAGRIVDHSTGRGISRALVQLDDDPHAIAMSDASGNVRFADAAPGVHRLTLLDSRATNGFVASRARTMFVTATRAVGRATQEVVSLVRGGRLRGAVCHAPEADVRQGLLRHAVGDSSAAAVTPTSYDPSAGGPTAGDPTSTDAASAALSCGHDVAIPNALVTLTADEDTVQVVTDGQGRFLAAGLRPGRWEVRVASAQLPDGLAFPPAGSVVDLAAGVEAATRLQAIAKPRTFRQLRVVAADAGSGGGQ